MDYTASLLPQKGSDFVEQIFNNDFTVSVVVEIEVLGFNDVPEKLAALEEFVETAKILPLDNAVTKRAIQLRRQYKKLKLGDAIIAATALLHGLTLISRNISDFQSIEGLQVIDPHLI